MKFRDLGLLVVAADDGVMPQTTEAINHASRKGDLIFEPFAGSGTTLIAAEQLGRRCRAIELSPAYCDVIIQRWENLTGQKAVRNG